VPPDEDDAAVWLVLPSVRHVYRPHALRSNPPLTEAFNGSSSKAQMDLTRDPKVRHVRVSDPRVRQASWGKRRFHFRGAGDRLRRVVTSLERQVQPHSPLQHRSSCNGEERLSPVIRRHSLHTLMLRFRVIRRLELRQWLALTVAAPMVVGVRLALWILPASAIVGFVSRLGRRSGSDASPHLTSASRMIWAVEAVARRVPYATCLTQAIAAKLLLDSLGEDVQLCLGVAHAASGAFRAHAWLERDGRALLGGAGIESLVRLPELPTAAHIRPLLTR